MGELHLLVGRAVPMVSHRLPLSVPAWCSKGRACRRGLFLKLLKNKALIQYITVIANLLVLVTLVYFFWFGLLAALGSFRQMGGIIQFP